MIKITCFCLECEKYKKCKLNNWYQFKPEIKSITVPIEKDNYIEKKYLSWDEIDDIKNEIINYFNNKENENIILPDLDSMSGIDMYAILLPFSYKTMIIFLQCENFEEDY